MIKLKGEKTPFGICGMVKRDMLDDVDNRYVFQPRYRSKGHAIESVLVEGIR
jgi:hypothetical protein